MKTINLSLTIDQCNVVLSSLAKQPFEAVAELINTIQQQAQSQLQDAQAEPEEVN